jgi:hypothetical protein
VNAFIDPLASPHFLTTFFFYSPLNSSAGMLSFLRPSKDGLSSDPRGVTHRENEKDLGNSAEIVVARLDSDSTSNVNPGELTVEEGLSRWIVFSTSQRFADKNVDTRHGRWDWAPFGRI